MWAVADKVKINLYMSADLLAAMKKLAARRDQSYAELVRTACRDYVIAHAQTIIKSSKTMETIE